MFIINFNFIQPIEEVNNYTESHRKYVAEQYKNGTFLIGGPKDPRNGGIVIANTSSEQKIRKILEKDPLITHKMAEYTLTKFTPLMSASTVGFLLNDV
ncbi:YciI family protein [Tenacibaculum sp. TC6]|uniref:YciI family protein n=1 Tax=Tenacibaculum sp. TC6 TaxID=3423223 RepID=UPI003D365495